MNPGILKHLARNLSPQSEQFESAVAAIVAHILSEEADIATPLDWVLTSAGVNVPVLVSLKPDTIRPASHTHTTPGAKARARPEAWVTAC